MRTLISNFFYAVGFVLIAFLYTSNPDELQIRDVARLVQSNTVQQLTFLLTLVLTGLEFMLNIEIPIPCSDGAWGAELTSPLIPECGYSG